MEPFIPKTDKEENILDDKSDEDCPLMDVNDLLNTVQNNYEVGSRVKTGPWSPQEDRELMDVAWRRSSWVQIGKAMNRPTKDCRKRWDHCTSFYEVVNHKPFSPEEDEVICRMHALVGSNWDGIARALPGRTPHQVKNRWNGTLRGC